MVIVKVFRRLALVLSLSGSWALLSAQTGPSYTGTPAVGGAGTPPAPPACTVQGPVENWDTMAQLIAGISSGTYGESFTDDQKAAWTDYAKIAALDWNRLKRRYVDRISAWRVRSLPRTVTVDSVFYPFSGPDATNPLAFFPDAHEYVLVGLEPVGCVPNTTETFTPEYWPALRQGWQSAVSMGFFKTIDMKRDISESGAGGILPVLLFLVSRAGNTVTEVNHIGIDKNGSIVHSSDPKETETRGVEIRFKDNTHGLRTLRYFASNLANYRMLQKPGTVKYLQGLPSSGVLVKSASYLMHNRSFSQVRAIVLNKANILIEDDSGVPYHLMDPSVWDIKLYGSYDKPIDLFKNSGQDDLKAAYDAKNEDTKDKVPSLDFPFGYKWRTGESNLLLAIKRSK
jgi:hypothetical protein